ncbi:phage holin family protein [Candidatus Peregrinibacteria bacterium]|jgi:putative membrane protein|nr:phage holin family protein [Candidatus Peregrinibacteria bacterium]MBT4631909.1 phage holin family protein [Candidatus Peregrinibacteria bacterium]MBT5824170.1 phage holin family protein [Candidatus Peregrinibacteria bacterium]
MRFLYLIVTNAFALFLVSILLEGVQFEGGITAPVIAGGIIALLNFFVKPILKFLSFPLVFISAGFFIIIINAFILYLANYIIFVMDIEGVAMNVDNLLTYVLAALIFGVANWLIHWFLKE